MALHKPLLLLKADLCLNPTRFQSWERLASAHLSVLGLETGMSMIISVWAAGWQEAQGHGLRSRVGVC